MRKNRGWSDLCRQAFGMGIWESWCCRPKQGIFLSVRGIPIPKVWCLGEQLASECLLSFPRPQVYPPHPHSILPYQGLPQEESVNVLPAFQEPHLQMTTRLTSMSLPFDQPHPQGLLPCQAQEHAVDVTMDEDNCLNQPVRTYHQGTWADEDMFPALLPPTEQDLTKLLLEGQGEAGGGSLGAQPLLQPAPYGQSGISMSHLDLRANPSW